METQPKDFYLPEVVKNWSEGDRGTFGRVGLGDWASTISVSKSVPCFGDNRHGDN